VGVPPEVAFDYLVDPLNRPAWQSSLARVEDVTGEPRVGQRWVDVTSPGLRPAMETTELDRPRRWTEHGTWRRVEAELTLTFTASPGGCEIGYDARVRARGLLAPVGLLVTRVAPLAVRSDLRRAGRILEGRAPGPTDDRHPTGQ
jgi:hypothetical protein